jgi:hypothetical protein
MEHPKVEGKKERRSIHRYSNKPTSTTTDGYRPIPRTTK